LLLRRDNAVNSSARRVRCEFCGSDAAKRVFCDAEWHCDFDRRWKIADARFTNLAGDV
jgi:hypothetical protein